MRIEFVKAPPGRTPNRERLFVEHTFIAALKANPARWAKYPLPIVSYSAARALASKINRGKKPSFGEGFESTQRAGEVFVRWIGGTP